MNKARKFDLSPFLVRNFSSNSIVNLAAFYSENLSFTYEEEAYWLIKAISLIDLTTLSGDDTWVNVERLGFRALHPLSPIVLKSLEEEFKINVDDITTAAVCVYPGRVEDVENLFTKMGVKLPIAAVATGFPSGQYPLKTRLDEIYYAIEKGATEIDIVINRSLVLDEMYAEVVEMRNACGQKAHMKTILAVGELENYKNIYLASIVCMLAGADFIKTSTGKEATINATLPVTVVMCYAIRDFNKHFNFKVGYKPAGGLKTHVDALKYLRIIKKCLGNDWLNPFYLRFGASSLLSSLDERLYKLCNKEHNPLSGELSVF